MHLVAQNGELADTETRVLDFEDVPVIEGAPIRARSKALEAMIVSSSASGKTLQTSSSILPGDNAEHSVHSDAQIAV